MKDLKNNIFDDFYFNGHYASEFGVKIAGENGLSPFSVLPPIDRKTEQILNVDGLLVVNQQLSPRTFVVPIVATDIANINIRNIAFWLSCYKLSPQDFWYKNDTVKIKCLLDTQPIDFEHYLLDGLLAGVVELKFIAYNPFYYDISDNYYIFTQGIDSYSVSNGKIYVSGNLKGGISFMNNGNIPSFPVIKINGNGNFTIGLSGTAYTMNNVSSYVYIDSLNMSCYKYISDFNTNQINDFSSNDSSMPYPKLIAGMNSISVGGIGTLTSLEVRCNSLYI